MPGSKRVFLFRDAEGRNVDVVATLEKLAGNRQAHFSVTSQRGSNHEEILAAAPPEVRDDLAALVKVHLRDEDGTPMHAVANAAYHLSEDRYGDALAVLGPDATIEDLVRTKVAAVTAMEKRGKADVEAWASDVRKAAAKVVAKSTSLDHETHSFQFQLPLRDAVLAFDAKLSGRPQPQDGRKARADKLLEGGVVARATSVAKNGVDAKVLDKATQSLRSKLLIEEVERLVERQLRAGWTDDAKRAVDLLQAPDFKADGRPDPERDETTFEGFASAKSLKMEVARTASGKDGSKWKGSITREGSEARHDFTYSMGSAYTDAPSLPMVLESLRMDAAAALDRTEDEFVDEMGYAGSAAELRRGIQAYGACRKAKEDLEAILGEDGYADLMTKVGDDPPLSPSYFEAAAPSP